MSAREIPLFGNADIFYRIIAYLSPEQLFPPVHVCTVWKDYINEMVKALHEQNGLLVENDKYSVRTWAVIEATTGGFNPKIVWNVFIGKPIGEIPRVSLAQIDKLWEKVGSGKRRYQLCDAVYRFKAVERSNLCEGGFLTIDEKGRLKFTKQDETTATEAKQIVVGTSSHNLIMLFNQPTDAKENAPVFANLISEAISEQLSSNPEASTVEFVEREVTKESRCLPLEMQVSKFGPIAGGASLIIHNGFTILKTGTCALTSVRAPETIRIEGKSLNLTFQSFLPGRGLEISDDDYDDGSDFTPVGPSVVTGVPSVVQPQPPASSNPERGE